MSSFQPDDLANGLLAALDTASLARLRPKLTRVVLETRQAIHDADGEIEFVYFPLSGMVSLVANLSDGMQAEVGVVGREGMVGLSIVFGATTSFAEAMMQMAGVALRMPARELKQEFDDNPAVRALLLRYAEAFQTQVMQTAACNGRHELEQRLARWLLMSDDRQNGEPLPLTHEFIAMMLGVHRPSVTVAAGVLSRAGLIRYASGRITVTNRAGLEQASCECYAAITRRFGKMLPRALAAE